MKRVLLARLIAAVTLLFLFALISPYLHAQTTIVQLSDTHIGLGRAPQGADNLRRAVQMINQRNPDAVIVSGDIGERPEAWDKAREILRGLHAKVYYVPGNHDVHSNDVDRYRKVFGDDYYKFQVRDVTVYALDSQLLGNWDNFDAHQEPPMSPETRAEGERMLAWLESQGGGQGAQKQKGKDGDKHNRDDQNRPDHGGNVVIAVQHVPNERDGGFPNDPKPYWTVNGDFKKREEQAFRKLGIHNVLVGHWHDGRVFDAAGFTWHVAPATSWSPFNSKLGFAVHTITPDGKVRTEFVYLDGSSEKH
jgi:UDP-2,3-diacylglucosamine pyrophosphatase LpxH